MALGTRCVLLLALTVVIRAHYDQAQSSSHTVDYTAEALHDKVEELPGWSAPLEAPLFAGYINVDEGAGRNLFYVLASASSQAPSDAPLLLWLNGGPGCSSLGGGFLSELGPFMPLPGAQQLKANPHAWHHAAHVVFVESPAFVGFSYSLTPQDAVVGDGRAARDMRQFLLAFMARFPHLAERQLFLSGESYAGHYIPGLAWEIIKGNRAATKPSLEEGWLPLKGLAVGNAWTDAAVDNLGAVDFWWSHALVSDSSAEGIRVNCNLSYIGPLDHHPASPSNPASKEQLCDLYSNRAMKELGDINIYHIYADMCSAPRAARPAVALAAAMAGGQGAAPMVGSLGARAAALQASRHFALHRPTRPNTASQLSEEDLTPSYDPCVDDEVELYLNRPEVQRALHVNQTHKLPGKWQDCTRKISYSKDDLMSSMLPVWRQLLDVGSELGLRFLVYSGDVDGIVPVVGTRRWVRYLGMKEVAGWRPYLAPSFNGLNGPQVAGYTVGYALPRAPAVSHATQPFRATALLRRGLRAFRTSTAATALPDTASVSYSVALADEYRYADSGDAGKGPGEEDAGFTFATVRGAGHMVPYVQPVRALHLITSFLTGAKL
ncbi:serine carboxypeptidase-domain-containing protein [Haematococcus lacustris]